jgi:riboflavin biosynthesis pyrimidine reductase
MMRRAWPQATEQPLSDEDLVAAHPYPDGGDRPHVRVNFVASLDGAVTHNGLSEALSGPDDQHLFRILRMLTDVVLVGAGTLRIEGYRPLRLDRSRREWRLAHGLAEHPVLAIVSSRLDLDPATDALAGAPVRPLVLTHAGAAADRRKALAAVADVVECGEEEFAPAAAMDALGGRGLRRVLCEGGPRLLGTLAAADRVDELCLSVAPLLTGPGAGRIIDGPMLPAVRPLVPRHILVGDDGTVFLRHTVAPVTAAADPTR